MPMSWEMGRGRWGVSEYLYDLRCYDGKGEFYTDTVSQVTCGRVSGKVSSYGDNFSVQVQVKGAVSSYTFNDRGG